MDPLRADQTSSPPQALSDPAPSDPAPPDTAVFEAQAASAATSRERRNRAFTGDAPLPPGGPRHPGTGVAGNTRPRPLRRWEERALLPRQAPGYAPFRPEGREPGMAPWARAKSFNTAGRRRGPDPEWDSSSSYRPFNPGEPLASPSGPTGDRPFRPGGRAPEVALRAEMAVETPRAAQPVGSASQPNYNNPTYWATYYTNEVNKNLGVQQVSIADFSSSKMYVELGNIRIRNDATSDEDDQVQYILNRLRDLTTQSSTSNGKNMLLSLASPSNNSKYKIIDLRPPTISEIKSRNFEVHPGDHENLVIPVGDASGFALLPYQRASAFWASDAQSPPDTVQFHGLLVASYTWARTNRRDDQLMAYANGFGVEFDAARAVGLIHVNGGPDATENGYRAERGLSRRTFVNNAFESTGVGDHAEWGRTLTDDLGRRIDRMTGARIDRRPAWRMADPAPVLPGTTAQQAIGYVRIIQNMTGLGGVTNAYFNAKDNNINYIKFDNITIFGFKGGGHLQVKYILVQLRDLATLSTTRQGRMLFERLKRPLSTHPSMHTQVHIMPPETSKQDTPTSIYDPDTNIIQITLLSSDYDSVPGEPIWGARNNFPTVLTAFHELDHGADSITAEEVPLPGERTPIWLRVNDVYVPELEARTVGLGRWSKSDGTENALRRELGVAERTFYNSARELGRDGRWGPVVAMPRSFVPPPDQISSWP